jgi:hypothetical protein
MASTLRGAWDEEADQHDEECELRPTNPSLALTREGNDVQAAGKKAEAALKEHVLALQRPRMRSIL